MKGYFRKRGEKWSYTVDVGLDKQTGKRRQITKSGFNTKKEAQEECAKMITELINGNFVEKSKLTLEKYMSDFLESKKPTIRENTFSTYLGISKNYIVPYFGKTLIQNIGASDISKMYAKLLEKVTSSTVRDVHKVLSLALNQAYKWGIIKNNPMQLIKKPKPNKKELRIWDKPQFQLFLSTVKPHRLYIAFHLALSTGMRQSEILGLRWKDVDLKNATLQIVQTLSHDGKKIMSSTKSKSGSRQITIDTSTIEALKHHRKIMLEERMQVDSFEDYGLVISTSKGTPQRPRDLMRVFYRYMKMIDVPKIAFHDLRHTHATLLLSEGINPKIVAERLGHADMRTTLEIYSHVLPNMQKEAAERISKFF